MSSELVPGDELRDLPAEDAAELRAFLEKERWFESKLQVLVAQPPIYPFLHPVLVSREQNEDDGSPQSSGYIRRGEDESEWALPSAARIAQWQKERDQLEEEVLTFDGGDLGRMKGKIRELTLAPLSPPSTHLVSITLALIVLIDRLLVLLRRRCDLLELTSVRLHWDDLRWRVSTELSALSNETTDLIAEKARWRPLETRHHHRGDSSPSTVLAMSAKAAMPETGASLVDSAISSVTRSAPVNSSEGLSSTGQTTASFPCTPVRRTVSPSGLVTASSTKAALALPLLQSHLVKIQTRHGTLTSTVVSRSGQLLDRMIELAGPLNNLGSISGPTRTVQQGEAGAVPRELLDVQEEMESAVQNLVNLTQYVEALVDQWRSADTVYLSLKRLRTNAEDLRAHILEALRQPASPSRHLSLATYLQDFLAHHRSVRIEETPLPTLPSLPISSDWNGEVMMRLRTINLDVQRTLHRCNKLLEWYDKLVIKRSRLVQQQTVVRGLEKRLRDLSHRLEDGTSTAAIPILDGRTVLATKNKAWILSVPEWTKEAEDVVASGGPACQRGTIAVLQLRQATAVPLHLRDDFVSPDRVSDVPAGEVEDEVESLLRLMQSMTTSCHRASCIAQVLPMIVEVLDASESIRRDMSALRKRLLSDIANISYCEHLQDLPEDRHWYARASEISQTIEHQVKRPLATVESLHAQDETLLPKIYRQAQSQNTAVSQDFGELRRMVDLYEGLRRQTIVVFAIREEAQRLTRDIELRKKEVADSARVAQSDHDDVRAAINASSLDSLISQLRKEVDTWRDGLSQRVPFLSSPASVVTGTAENLNMVTTGVYPTNDASSRQLLPPTTSSGERSIKPSSTPLRFATESDEISTKGFEDFFNLAAVDRAVRLEVNTICAKVSAAFSGLMDSVGYPLNPKVGFQLNGRVGEDVTSIRERSKRALPGPKDFLTNLHTGPAIANLPGPATPNSSTTTVIGANSNSALPLRDLDDIFSNESPSLDSYEDQGAQSGNDDGDKLRARLNALGIVAMVFPLSSAHQSPPSQRRIPNQTLVDSAELGLSSIEADYTASCIGFDDADSPGDESLGKALQEARAAIPRLHGLAHFAAKVQNCDQILSNFLDAIDAFHAEAAGFLERQCARAEAAVGLVADSAQPLIDDPRVEAELKRLTDTWNELQAINAERHGDNETVPRAMRTRGIVFMSPAPSDVTRPASLASRRNCYRSVSSPLSPSSFISEAFGSGGASNLRAVPETPTRFRDNSLREKKQRPHQDSVRSLQMSPAQPPTQSASPSRIPRPVQSTTPTFVSHAATWTPGRTRRVQQSSRTLDFNPPKSTSGRAYVADPLNKLDVAVGTVINELKVDVPVVPVGVNSADQWKDQSGKYWIGAEGRAKLCYCRMLRSRMVMVRVGGGWVELSKFLLDHFADTFHTWQLSSTDADISMVSHAPVTSQKLASSINISGEKPVGSVAPLNLLPPPQTPIRPALPLSAEISGPLTPSRRLSTSDQSEGSRALRSTSFSPSLASPSGGALFPAGPSSPLIPLHLIRRASESPPVRQRERERLKVGRRSILGREGSIAAV